MEEVPRFEQVQYELGKPNNHNIVLQGAHTNFYSQGSLPPMYKYKDRMRLGLCWPWRCSLLLPGMGLAPRLCSFSLHPSLLAPWALLWFSLCSPILASSWCHLPLCLSLVEGSALCSLWAPPSRASTSQPLAPRGTLWEVLYGDWQTLDQLCPGVVCLLTTPTLGF